MTVGDAWSDCVSELEDNMAWYLRPDYPIRYCECERLVTAIGKMLKLSRVMMIACDRWGMGDYALIKHIADLKIPGEVLEAYDEYMNRLVGEGSQEGME